MPNFKMTLLAIAAPMGACATKGVTEAPVVPAGYNFAYTMPHGADLRMVQAFDDGRRTYLQFLGAVDDLKVQRTETSLPLEARRSTPYIEIEGVYDRLLVSANQHQTALINEATLYSIGPSSPESGLDSSHAVAEPPGSLSLPAVGVPDALQTMRASLRVSELNREIGDLEQRLKELEVQLEAAHREGRATNLGLRATALNPRVVIRFDNNSAEVRVDEDMVPVLISSARAANRIYLHGHTDAYTASDRATDLAIRRAVAVRDLLIAQDVAPARVRLFYRGAGGFVANNATADGKSQNRRVDIEFRKW